jgi:hypothetical protein
LCCSSSKCQYSQFPGFASKCPRSTSNQRIYFTKRTFKEGYLTHIPDNYIIYFVKHIILWQAKNTPKDHFAQRLLLFRLTDALNSLQDCLRSNSLRSYMIEDRNIFYRRISENQRKLVIDKKDKR